MSLYKKIDNLIPFSKKGIRIAYFFMLIPFFSTPFIIFFMNTPKGWDILIMLEKRFKNLLDK